ncbi:MAG: hypothetical protein ACR2K3_12710, partial [Nocardioides sp.]
LCEPDGRRVLLAPDAQVADFITSTYLFDRLETLPVECEATDTAWRIGAGDLQLSFRIGRRLPIGRLLRAVPRPLATAPGWTRVTDAVARVGLRGVRTRGTSGRGRIETYGATDLHAVTSLEGTWRGQPLGALAPVWPEPRFGFGSTPPQPSVTTLVTSVRT